MNEFTVGNYEFRAARLDAFQQLHVSRKIAPLIPALIPAFMEIAKHERLSLLGRERGKPVDLSPELIATFTPLLQPFADALAGLSDTAADYVVATCLSVVKVKRGDQWMPVTQNGVIVSDDLNDIGTVIPIVFRVIVGNLGRFIHGLLTSQRETLGAPSAA